MDSFKDMIDKLDFNRLNKEFSKKEFEKFIEKSKEKSKEEKCVYFFDKLSQECNQSSKEGFEKHLSSLIKPRKCIYWISNFFIIIYLAIIFFDTIREQLYRMAFSKSYGEPFLETEMIYYSSVVLISILISFIAKNPIVIFSIDFSSVFKNIRKFKKNIIGD